MVVSGVPINVTRLEGTGLFVAVSADIRGLLVHGRSLEEVEARLPRAINDIVSHKNGVENASSY